MYFAFIDESGTPELEDKNNQFYVLIALIMHEKGIPFLNENTKYLRMQIWDQLKNENYHEEIPEDFELHIKDITNRIKYYEKIKDDDPKLVEILDQIYNFISKLYAKVLSVIIPKEEFYERYSEGITTWAFKLLVERLSRFIYYQKRYRKEYMLIVMDSVGQEVDNKRRKEIEEYMLYGTGSGERPENVIETPFIGDSKIHKGVQIADAVAYMLRRHTRKYFGFAPKAFLNQYSDRYMKKIAPMFYVGLRWTPKDMIKFFPGVQPVPDDFWKVLFN